MGGEIYTAKDFNIASLSHATPSNTLYVGANSSLSASGIGIYSICNKMIVSNGTVTARTGGISLAHTYERYTTHSNNTVVVQGDCPSIRCTNGTFSVMKNSAARFEIPVAGYAEGCATTNNPIIRAKEVQVTSGCKLEFPDLEDIIDQRKYDNNKLVLMTAETMSINKNMFNETEAALPDGVTLAQVKDGDVTHLVLRLPSTKGTVIVVE